MNTNTIFAYVRKLRASDAFFLKIAILASSIFLLWFFVEKSTESQVTVPSSGGKFTEGIVGTPRFINPVLAFTRADKDVTTLVYDGLLQLDTEGVLVPNIAETITISEDGLVYNITLRDDVVFHDGTPLTADDVVFTIGRIQDPGITSPLRSNFDGVTVEQLGTYELNFVLPEAYAPFIENLTFGILPRHLWEHASNEEFPFSQLNSEPIGSGPYKIDTISRNTSGIPEIYILTPHTEHQNGAPKIHAIELHFYSNEDTLIGAFNEGVIDAFAGIDQKLLEAAHIDPATHTIVTAPLPRTFALFFNQNKSAVLRDGAVREALELTIDRELLIETVLGGYGNPLNSPIPPGFGVSITPTTTASSTRSGFDTARAILRNAGWEPNNETGIWEKEIDGTTMSLAFSIATANSIVFEETAEYLRAAWERLGASVSIKQFEQSDLTQAVIRPRDYEALLFGTVVGRALDFYSFWHSSQRNDPGLNVSLYANITTDAILHKARISQDPAARNEEIKKFAREIHADVPAIFLYSPEFLYVFPKEVTGAHFTGIVEPSERFASIRDWYIESDSVWPIFKNAE